MSLAIAEVARARRAPIKAQKASVFMPTFRGVALEAQYTTAHEWMLAGPAETGKTFAALWRLDTLLRSTPKSQYALVRRFAVDIGPTVLNTYKRVTALSKSGAVPYGGSRPEWYDYPNGARLYIGGMDRPGKVLSGERDGIYVNQGEELDLDDWETLTTRATGRGAVTDTPMVFGDCNPGPEYHWIINRPSLKVLYSKHEDNPTLYDEAGNLTEQGRRTMSVLDALTGLRKKRLRYGLWVGAEGQVYEGFDPAIHVIEPFAIPDAWPRYRSIDFGYTNPFSCSWWAKDADGRLYRYRQIYMTGRTVREHLVDVQRYSQGEQIAVTVADHDAEDRATLAEDVIVTPELIREKPERYGWLPTSTFKADGAGNYRIPGIRTQAADKRLSIGIEKMQDRLVVQPDGKPRIVYVEGALVEVDESLRDKHRPLDTIQEHAAYVWPKDVSGKAQKEVPVDANNHGLDESRYMVMHFDKPEPQSQGIYF